MDTTGIDAGQKPKYFDAELAKRIENDFSYHPPFGDQVERYTQLRIAARALALGFMLCCPKSREQSLAFTYLEQAVMMANAAIARNETPGPEYANDDPRMYTPGQRAIADFGKVLDGLPDCAEKSDLCSEFEELACRVMGFKNPNTGLPLAP